MRPVEEVSESHRWAASVLPKSSSCGRRLTPVQPSSLPRVEVGVTSGLSHHMRALLFHNPSAGMGDHTRQDLAVELEAKGMHVTYCSAKEAGFPDCLAQEADVVLAAGGDGTVCKVVAHLLDRQRPFGIMPLGGSNNVATSLGFHRMTVLAGDWPGNAAPKPFHVGRIRTSGSEKVILEGAGFGALAASIHDKKPTPRSIREKILNGRRGLATALAENEPTPLRMQVDGIEVCGDWLMAEVLVTSHSGPRLALAPRAGALDGRLSVVLLDEDRRLDMLEWLNAPDSAPPPVHVLPARHVVIDTEDSRLLRIDDSVEEVASQRIELQVDDDPFHVLLPTNLQEGGE